MGALAPKRKYLGHGRTSIRGPASPESCLGTFVSLLITLSSVRLKLITSFINYKGTRPIACSGTESNRSRRKSH